MGTEAWHGERLDEVFAERVRPPRRNGELVFESPWQSRLFAVVVALGQEGGLDWESFRDRSIDGLREALDSDDVPFAYYAVWLDAVESELLERGDLTSDDLSRSITREREHDEHGDAVPTTMPGS